MLGWFPRIRTDCVTIDRMLELIHWLYSLINSTLDGRVARGLRLTALSQIRLEECRRDSYLDTILN